MPILRITDKADTDKSDTKIMLLGIELTLIGVVVGGAQISFWAGVFLVSIGFIATLTGYSD
jgi:energy-converting hydrogenase Eha subunit E